MGPHPEDDMQLFLCGDVMTGRGIDQILPCPGDPVLHESHAREMTATSRCDDVIVASIHWGSNRGDEVDLEEAEFARRLIDEGVHVVHGHSSHHVKTLTFHHANPILHGRGDFPTDYEGIGEHESYRPGLALI